MQELFILLKQEHFVEFLSISLFLVHYGGGIFMFHMALDWVRERSEIHAIAIGCRDEKELITDIGWMEGLDPPEAKEIRLLDRNMAFDKEPRCHAFRELSRTAS